MNTNIQNNAPGGAFTIADFTRLYGIGTTKTYALIKSGQLKARKAGDRTLIAKADAEAWFQSLPELRTSTRGDEN